MGWLDKLFEAAQSGAALRAESEARTPEYNANIIKALLPSDAVDAGLMAMTGPSGKLVKLGGAGLAAMGYAPEAEAAGPLMKLARQMFTGGDKAANKIRDLIYPYVKARSGTPQSQQIIANYMPEQVESYPETITHAFSDNGLAKAIYQLAARPQGTYIPNLVSFEKGYGHQALEDAYQQAKRLAPDKPVYLTSTADPETLAFYRRQKGWIEDQEEGANRFTRKARGGLVQMKECSCGR